MKNKYILKFFIIAILVSISFYSVSYAADPEELSSKDIRTELENNTEQQLEKINTVSIDKLLEDVTMAGNPLVKNLSITQLASKIIRGDFKLDGKWIFGELVDIFFYEVRLNLKWILQIIIIAIICSILHNLQSSFQDSSIGEIAYFACYITISVLIIKSLISVLNVSNLAIHQMVSFIQIFSPILIALLLAIGGVASSSIFQPTIAMLVGITSTFIEKAILPMIIFLAVLSLVNNISNTVKLDRLLKVFKNICVWILGITFTIFIGVLAIQGMLSSTFDGISIRTAKYTIETFVPVVGGLFSQTVDTIIGCSLLVKNGLGVAGLIILIIICIYPIMKIFTIIVVYKLASALLEPVSDERIAKCLSDIGDTISLILLIIIGIAIMLFIFIGLIIGAGNINMMMR